MTVDKEQARERILQHRKFLRDGFAPLGEYGIITHHGTTHSFALHLVTRLDATRNVAGVGFWVSVRVAERLLEAT